MVKLSEIVVQAPQAYNPFTKSAGISVSGKVPVEAKVDTSSGREMFSRHSFMVYPRSGYMLQLWRPTIIKATVSPEISVACDNFLFHANMLEEKVDGGERPVPGIVGYLGTTMPTLQGTGRYFLNMGEPPCISTKITVTAKDRKPNFIYTHIPYERLYLGEKKYSFNLKLPDHFVEELRTQLSKDIGFDRLTTGGITRCIQEIVSNPNLKEDLTDWIKLLSAPPGKEYIQSIGVELPAEALADKKRRINYIGIQELVYFREEIYGKPFLGILKLKLIGRGYKPESFLPIYYERPFVKIEPEADFAQALQSLSKNKRAGECIANYKSDINTIFSELARVILSESEARKLGYS